MRRSLIALMLVATAATPAFADVPANDRPEDATPVTTFPATLEVDTSEATTGTFEGDCGVAVAVRVPMKAVWYRLDLPADVDQIRVRYSEYSARVVLWSVLGHLPSDEPVLTQVGCAYAGDPYPTWVYETPLYMSVGTPLVGNVPPFTIEIEAGSSDAGGNGVPNDVSYRATRITSLPYEVTQQTWDAEYDYDRQGCENGAYVWYTYTPPVAETLEIAVGGTDYTSTSLSVYAVGTDVRTLGCDTAYGQDNRSIVRTPVDAEIPVLIGIGEQGDLSLSVRSVTPDPGSDQRAHAAPLSYGVPATFSTAGATLEDGEPVTCGAGGSLWYELPARHRGSEVVFTSGASVAAVVGNDVTACSTNGTLALPAGSPTTHLQVRSASNITGTISLHFDPPLGRPITGASPFAPDCDPTADPYMNSEVEISQAVDPKDPEHIVVTWQQDRHPDKGGAHGIGAAVSFDGGETWANRTIPGVSICSGGPFLRATDPWTAIDADGTAYVMSLGYDPVGNPPADLVNTVLINRSEDGGLTWGDPIIVAASPGVLFHDKEALTADPNTPGLLYAVWDIYPTNVVFPVFSRSEDGGRTWTPPVPLPTTGGGAGDQIAVLDDGTLVEIADRGAVQSITSRDRGTTWSMPSEIGSSGGNREGPPGVRGGAYIPSVSTDGHSVFVTWSDTYLTYFARSDDAGATWTATEIGEFGPPFNGRFTTAVASAANGHLAVMTYMIDGDRQAWLNLATSADGGTTWSEQPITDTFDMTRAPVSRGRGYFLGDYFGLVRSGNDVVAAFAAVPPGDEIGVSNVYSLRVTP